MKSPQSGSKKPYATIDVKATEVAEEKPSEAPVPVLEAGAEPATGGSAEINSDVSTAGAAAAASAGGSAEASADSQASSSAESETPTAPQTQTAPAPRRAGITSVLTHLAAGFGGGFLALLGADSLGPGFGLSTEPKPAAAVELQRRVGDIEKKLNERPATTVSDTVVQKIAALESRLAQLDELKPTIASLRSAQERLTGDTKALEQRVTSSAAPADLGSRVSKLEDTLATFAAAGAGDPTSGRLPQLAALAGKISDLETALGNQIGGVRQQLTQDFNTRAEKIAEASEAAKSGTQRIDRELATVKADAARLSQRLDTLKTDGERIGQTLRGMQDENQALKGALESARADVSQQLKSVARPDDVAGAVSPLSAKLSAVEQTVQSVVKGEADRKSTAERIVLALELGNLKRALDRGGAYAAELNEVKKVAGPKLNLAALESRKTQGVPTLADLSRDFRPTAHAMLDAETEREDASVLERLLSSAKSVIRVRKVGQGAEDKSVDAVIARMEQALEDGRPAAVVEEAKKLSPKAHAAAHDWLAAVEARASVDAALAEIDSQLKAALAPRPEAQKGIN